MMKEKWPGGYIRVEAGGRRTFIIERRVAGKRYHVSTRTHSLRAAMKQLERFEANPEGYQPEGEGGSEPIRLDSNLAGDFFDWQLARGVTRKHASEVKGRLAHWIVDLAGKDLRKVTLRDDILPGLEKRQTARAARISTIKAFYGWLRKERHLLTSAEDCTLDLPVPQARPEKWVRRKAVELERVQAALGQLDGPYRDLLLVASATGWHFTELARLIREPDSEIVRTRQAGTLAVLVTRHKSREMTRTPVTDPDVLAAAERLRARGRVPKRANAKLADACKDAGVATFTFGVIRHSVATWAVEGGAVPALVSAFLGHKDPRTLRRFYSDVAVPTAPVGLPKLHVVH